MRESRFTIKLEIFKKKKKKEESPHRVQQQEETHGLQGINTPVTEEVAESNTEETFEPSIPQSATKSKTQGQKPPIMWPSCGRKVSWKPWTKTFANFWMVNVFVNVVVNVCSQLDKWQFWQKPDVFSIKNCSVCLLLLLLLAMVT